MVKILLNKSDYKFIEDFCKRYKIREGKGIMLMLEIFLHEYKTEKKKNGRRKTN